MLHLLMFLQSTSHIGKILRSFLHFGIVGNNLPMEEEKPKSVYVSFSPSI